MFGTPDETLALVVDMLHENMPEFPGGRGGGVQSKKPSVGGVRIFSGTAHSSLKARETCWMNSLILIDT